MYESFKNHLLQLVQICASSTFNRYINSFLCPDQRLTRIYTGLLREKPIWHACDAIARLCKRTYLFLRYSSGRARWPESIVVPGTASVVTSRYVTSSERNVERGVTGGGCVRVALSTFFLVTSMYGSRAGTDFQCYSINTFNFTQYENILSSNLKLYIA